MTHKIPKGWKVMSIGEVCDTTSGRTPSRSVREYYKYGTIPWVKTGELTEKYIYNTGEKITEEAIKDSSAKLLPINTVLVAMYGATIGKTSILKCNATTNQACCAIIPNKNLDHEFLYYFLTYSEKDLIKMGVGAAQPNINQGLIRGYKILIPSLLEQQEIVRILSTIDEQILQVHNVIKKIKELKDGLIQTLLKKETLPIGWELKSIKHLLDSDDIGVWGEDSSKGLPVLRSTNFTEDGKIDFMNVAYRSLPDNKVEEKRLMPGDILLERSGGGPQQPIGRVVYFEDAQEYYTYGNFIQRLRGNKDLVLPKFLFYSLWRLYKSGITERYQQATTGIRNLIYKDYLEIKLPIPKNRDEQFNIINILSNIDLQIEGYQSKEEQLQLLKKGLMQQLLTGKKRVPPF